MTKPEPPATPTADARPDWARLHLWQIQPIRDILVGLVILALFWLGQAISVVTVPVLLAVLLAYLFEPVIRILITRAKLTRQSAVAAMLVAAVLFIAIPATLATTFGIIQALGLASRLTEKVQLVTAYVEASTDQTIASAQQNLEQSGGESWLWIGQQLRDEQGSDLGVLLDAVSTWTQANADGLAARAVGIGSNVLQTALGLIAGSFSLAFMAFLTAFFFFFIATRWIEVKDFASRFLPDKHREQAIDLVTRFDRVISAFVRGRLTIAFVQAILFTIGYLIIGVPAAFVLGPVVAILSIVPYLALVGVPISVTLLWLEDHAGLRGHILWVFGAPLALYFMVQAADDYVLTPLIQGKETGMSTPLILFASLAGGALFGVFGLLIAIPIAACLKIVIEAILWPRFRAWAEGRSADFLPIDAD
jgi:predicted PurR-regulated permease PerM